ncbi:peptide deformylase [Nonomuraea jabiensis]|uniref:peptide deformylase n=1 Tax=Nonomuraea jabiensis TaxID=882448 RepID=UPI003D750361
MTNVRLNGVPVDAYPRHAPEARRGRMRPITTTGHPVLHRPCRPVTAYGTTELAQLVEDLFATMYAADGMGLAANQIGVNLRLFVYDWTENGTRHVGHLANPVITRSSGRTLDEEGCLSVPGRFARVPRAEHVAVHGADQHGTPLTITGSGYFARCLQHETDYTRGRLFRDRRRPKKGRSR